MTIHLPPKLANPILDVVRSGRHASLDDAMLKPPRCSLSAGTRNNR